MNEPTYEYIKGQGWVINPYESLSANIEKYRVTVIERLSSNSNYVVVTLGPK